MSMSEYFRSVEGQRESLAARYGDLLLVAAIVAIVALMVLPLPLWVIDFLVAVNIAGGLGLLLMAVYIRGPLEFSVFPSVLLISTLFRLSLSIATTRMILLHGNGGHIIDTFGKMVAGNNLVVGLVVFLIITVVQFIVIAKGAERVAEVAARFTLDAMPGKQLSIDSDLRSGLIDKDEAKRRRRALEQESKLHGSLDGAMKFVKGDAIAGIVIILINLLGGLAIGVLQQGMEMSAAITKYSILTIGDGMVAQIPALLGAMAAGLIVTHTTSEEQDRHLGDAVRKQVASKPRVQIIAGAICLLLALVPGFPALVFIALGAASVLSGVLLTPPWRRALQRRFAPALRRVQRTPEDRPRTLATALPQGRPAVPLLVHLPAAALAEPGAQVLTQTLQGTLDEFHLRLGLPLPSIAIHGRPDTTRWQLLAYEVPVAEGAWPSSGGELALAEAVRQTLRRHAALFIGVQETTTLLTRASADLPDVVKEVLRVLPMQKVAEVLRRLVAEEVSIRNLRDILEALAEAGQREKDVLALTEFARIALRRQLSHQMAPQGELRALLLTPDVEDTLRQAVRVTGGVSQLALDPAVARDLVEAVRLQVEQLAPRALVTSVDLRWHLRKLIEPECFDTPVLSFHELMPNVHVDAVGHITMPRSMLLEAA